MATTHFDHLILGGGMVADAAARGIRELDPDGTIGIVSDDVDEPYARPALSKKLWTDPDFTWDDVPLGTAADTGATVLLETTATGLDVRTRTVTTEQGDAIGYGSLLIATGGHPVPLPAHASDVAMTFRTAEDYRRLRRLATEQRRIAVVGGGFIGTELAAALIGEGVPTTLVHTREVLLGDVLPAALAADVERRFVDAGVEIVAGTRVERVSGDAGAGVTLHLDDDRTIEVDAVVSGLGIEPATAIAESAHIETGDGIVVDERLRTSAAHVWSAGDVAVYPDALLGVTRVEHVDNAKAMGRIAGRNLAGADDVYDHTPFFYSVLFGTRYEAVGTLDASLETIEDWAEPLERGVVYYRDAGRIVGVLLWGVEDATDAARAVLREQPAELVGRIR